MLNLLKMNLYRMFHIRSMLTIFLVTTLFSIFSSSMVRYDTKLLQEEAEKQAANVQETQSTEYEQESQNPDVFVGIAVVSPGLENGKPAAFLKHFCSDVSSGIILIFLTIGTVIFINGEEKSGFIKNIAGQTGHKSYIYVSKFLAVLCYTLISTLLYGLVEFITLKIFFGNDMAFGLDILKKMLPVFGIQFLLFAAFVSGITMLTTLCRSTSLGITTGLLACLGVISQLLSYLEKMLDTHFIKYTLIINLKSVGIYATGKDMRQAAVVSIVFLLLYTFIGLYSFIKRDVV